LPPASSASVRADLLQNYSELFGTKTIDGRKVNVEDLVASKQLQYDFLDPNVTVTGPDGNRTTVGDIRQGMLDHDDVYDVFESAEGVAA
jgi:hypothetical protein